MNFVAAVLVTILFPLWPIAIIWGMYTIIDLLYDIREKL